MSLAWMPVETAEKSLSETTRYGLLRQLLDVANVAMMRMARWFSRQADTAK